MHTNAVRAAYSELISQEEIVVDITDISEAKILAAANDMVSLGLQDAGYEYVNLDVCWPWQQ